MPDPVKPMTSEREAELWATLNSFDCLGSKKAKEALDEITRLKAENAGLREVADGLALEAANLMAWEKQTARERGKTSEGRTVTALGYALEEYRKFAAPASTDAQVSGVGQEAQAPDGSFSAPEGNSTPGPAEVCETCKGNKKLWNYAHDHVQPLREVSRDCPDCDGTGKKKRKCECPPRPGFYGGFRAEGGAVICNTCQLPR